MNSTRRHIVCCSLLIIALTGCGERTRTDATDQNCAELGSKKLLASGKLSKDEYAELASKCQRRGTFKPSPPRSW